MVGLDAQISIISYAVVSTKYQGKNNLVISFLPLIEHLLISCSEKTISKKDVKSLFKETYGYEIPAAVLETLLKRLKNQEKIEFLKNECVEIFDEKLIDYDSRYEIDLRSLISDFSLFLNKQGKEIDKNIVIKVFLDFLLNNVLEFNSFMNYNSGFENTNNNLKEYTTNIVDFLLEERKNETHNYKFLKDIYYGIILSTLLISEKDSVVDDNVLCVENVLLDSNFIFRLLDLQTEFELIASKETFKLLKGLGCSFYVLPITIKQISDTLKGAMKYASNTVNNVLRFYGDEKFSGLNSACIRRNLTSIDLVEISSSLEEKLKNEYGIECLPEENMKELNYDKDDFSSLSKVKPDSLEFGIIHDLYLIDFIKKHRSTYVYKMDKAKWWVLTDDNKLTKWNTDSKKGIGIQECITESQIAIIYWLEKNDFTTDSLFNTALALRNREAVSNDDFKLISLTIERQAKKYRENPDVNKRLPLIFTDNLIGLKEMACEDEELVDNKFEEALLTSESILNENKKLEETKNLLISENKEISISYKKAIEEKNNEIAKKKSLLDEETLQHIETLKSLRNEKEKNLKNLKTDQDKYKKTSTHIQNSLNYVIFVPILVILLVCVAKKQFSLSKIKGLYNDNQWIFWIIGTTTVGGLFKKIRELFGKWLYNIIFVMRKNKEKDFDEKIQKCEEEIIDIQRQIDDRIKQNKK